MSLEEQLAKLQTALIEGKIDRRTYETLKADLLQVTSDDSTRFNADDLSSLSAEQLLKKAKEFMDRGRLEEAEACYEKALEVAPNEATLLLHRASLLCEYGQLEEALSDFEQAISDGISLRQNLESWFLYAVCLGKAGKAEEAKSQLTDLLQANPSHVDAWGELAMTHLAADEMETGWEVLNRMIDALPDSADAFSTRGAVRLLHSEYSEAVEEYTQALSIQPAHLDSLVGRGAAFLELEQYEKATLDFNKAVYLDEGNGTALCKRGWAYLKRDELPKAIVDFNKALRINPEYSLAFFGRGAAYLLVSQRKLFGNDEQEKAKTDLARAKTLNPALEPIIQKAVSQITGTDTRSPNTSADLQHSNGEDSDTGGIDWSMIAGSVLKAAGKLWSMAVYYKCPACEQHGGSSIRSREKYREQRIMTLSPATIPPADVKGQYAVSIYDVYHTVVCKHCGYCWTVAKYRIEKA